MKRSGWRSAKTDASCGEKTSANEKVPSQELRGTFKNCQRLILAESVESEYPFRSTTYAENAMFGTIIFLLQFLLLRMAARAQCRFQNSSTGLPFRVDLPNSCLDWH